MGSCLPPTERSGGFPVDISLEDRDSVEGVTPPIGSLTDAINHLKGPGIDPYHLTRHNGGLCHARRDVATQTAPSTSVECVPSGGARSSVVTPRATIA